MFDDDLLRHLPAPRTADAAIVVAALAPAFIDQATTDASAWPALAWYGMAAAVALAVRRRWPLAAFAATLLALAATEIACAAAETKLSSLAVLPLAFALYAVGAHTPLRRSVVALVGGAAITVIGVAINHATAPDGWRGGSDVLAVLSPLPAAWGLGLAARSRRDSLAAAERRAADAQREQQLRVQSAAAAERTRIARDMHDVVAHSLTLLVVHAETMRARSAELPPWAREGVDAMASAGRQATSEMRELLGILRGTNGETAPRTPAPQLADLPGLVEKAEQAGTPARLDIYPEATSLPRPVQLAAYRLLQECLANARRHAPGAEVTFRIGTNADEIRVEAECGPPPPDHRPRPGAGVGLTGLNERFAALGGNLTAGPVSDGGFRITATIPTTAPSGGKPLAAS
ncbi:sensor histidine kinase [Streptomyces prunicolor]|uniref:sensor histidine kinase n=1 Tax=Streptomyces prunicolor TaxID=67348 RepID=UPI003411FA6A